MMILANIVWELNLKRIIEDVKYFRDFIEVDLCYEI